MSSPISTITFTNYKGFRNFSLQLRSINFLVGPNNCGKSTVIGSLRILDAGIRKARSRNPERLLVSGQPVKGYEVDLDDLDISTENVHTDYNDLESSIEFRLANGNALRLVFPSKGGCFLVPESEKVPAILDQLRLSSVLATHSTEIISQADASEILAIDKSGRFAKRLKDVKEIRKLL